MLKHEFELTNLDKVLFPKSKITKSNLIDYYKQIAPCMLPFMANRALSLYRFPDGIAGQKFYQKNLKLHSCMGPNAL